MRFAVCAVAIAGGPFIATSQKAVEKIGAEKAARFLVIDTTLAWLLRLQAHALATAFGMFAYYWIDVQNDLGIFAGIMRATTGGDADSGQYVILGVIIVFYGCFRRPLVTITVVMLINIYAGDAINSLNNGSPAGATFVTQVNAFLAAMLIGGIGSLTLHQFGEAAKAALDSLLYCWSLDEACGHSTHTSHRRERIGGLMAKTVELQPTDNQPPSMVGR